ncbi:hypothetical protein GH733_019653, partial [Mirounga leonina]
MELALVIDLKEVDCTKHFYALVSKMDLIFDGKLGNDKDMPKASCLMTVLVMIFRKGNRVTEEEIWEVL